MNTWILDSQGGSAVDIDISRASDSRSYTAMWTSHTSMCIGGNLSFVAETSLRGHRGFSTS